LTGLWIETNIQKARWSVGGSACRIRPLLTFRRVGSLQSNILHTL